MRSKPILFVAMPLVILLAFAACAPRQPLENVQPTELPLETPVPEETVPEVDIPEAEVDEATRAKLDAMQPVFDSVIRAMRAQPEGKQSYDSADPYFFWSVLYHLSTNFGAQHPLVEETDGQYSVPRKVMQEFATACFGEYSDLLALPAESGIVYDESRDAYLVGMSDIGDSYSQIVSYEMEGDDQYALQVDLLTSGEEKPLTTYHFIVTANPYIDGITDPIFYYTVWYAEAEQAEFIDDDGAQPQENVEAPGEAA